MGASVGPEVFGPIRRWRRKASADTLAAAVAKLPGCLATLHTYAVFDWNDLRYFLAFARTGSMLAAAKTLGVNQSTVSRRLAELEERLGRRLVERHVGGYRLTELGEQLRPDAERVETAVVAFERHLTSCQKEITGVLRLTCPTTVARRLAGTSLIDTFHARHPGLRVELVMSDQYLDLAKGEADIAIRAGQSPDEDLVGRKIGETRWAVYASRSYVDRHGRPQRTEDIERHFVVATDGAMTNYRAAQWLRSIAPHATIAARCDSWPGLLLAVKSGAGLAPVPIAEGDRDNDLVRVIDDIPELLTPLYLLTHRDLQRTPRIRAFLDFVETEIKAFRATLSGKAQE
jgi:DNA-binding transcriptional LysR family regulator